MAGYIIPWKKRKEKPPKEKAPKQNPWGQYAHRHNPPSNKTIWKARFWSTSPPVTRQQKLWEQSPREYDPPTRGPTGKDVLQSVPPKTNPTKERHLPRWSKQAPSTQALGNAPISPLPTDGLPRVELSDAPYPSPTCTTSCTSDSVVTLSRNLQPDDISAIRRVMGDAARVVHEHNKYDTKENLPLGPKLQRGLDSQRLAKVRLPEYEEIVKNWNRNTGEPIEEGAKALQNLKESEKQAIQRFPAIKPEAESLSRELEQMHATDLRSFEKTSKDLNISLFQNEERLGVAKPQKDKQLGPGVEMSEQVSYESFPTSTQTGSFLDSPSKSPATAENAEHGDDVESEPETILSSHGQDPTAEYKSGPKKAVMGTGPSVILQEPVHVELCDSDSDNTDVEPSVPDRTEGAAKPPQISTRSRQRPSVTELRVRPVTRKEVPRPAQSKSGIAQRRRNM